MNPITKRIRTNCCNGILHDSRRDCDALGQYCNMLADALNGVIEDNKYLNREISKLKRAMQSKNPD